MKISREPSVEFLNECFAVDETSPSGLRWKSRPRRHFRTDKGFKVFNSSFVGCVAGTICSREEDSKLLPYWQVGLKPKKFFNHRIVFMLVNNCQIPDGYDVDHDNGDTLKNVGSNLRLATRLQNASNAKNIKKTESGIKGVTRTSGGRWAARIGYNKMQYNLGSFSTVEEAHKVYLEKAKELQKEFHREFV